MFSSENARQVWKSANLAPLWESPNAHKPPPGPVPAYRWAWNEVRPMLELAFQETSPAAVERRVLQLMSPMAESLADEYTAGNVLVGLQSLLPGEAARPHRHSMNALRFAIEGSGATTVVNGKDCPMEFGDLILTPAWCWHEHRHEGSEPMIWLDVLDVPLHAYLGTVEFQPGPVSDMPATIDDRALSVPNIMPEQLSGGHVHSPVFRYPYKDVLAALAASPLAADGSKCVRYVNPLTGSSALKLLDSLMVELEPGRRTAPTRNNSNTVCLVVDGHGETVVGEQVIRWEAKDVFTLPQGNWIEHSALGQSARLFMVSDRAVLKKLGIYKEEIRARAV